MEKKKSSAKKSSTTKVKHYYGIGDDGWGIHDVKDAPKTTKKKSTGKSKK